MHLADAIVYLSGYGFLGSGPATDGRGNRQISTPYKINTPEPIEKNLAQLITSARGPPIPNLVQIHLLRASVQIS